MIKNRPDDFYKTRFNATLVGSSDNLIIVSHKTANARINFATELEWATQEENMRNPITIKKLKNNNTKTVPFEITLDDNAKPTDKLEDYEPNVSPRWFTMVDFEGEVWVPVQGIENAYVSNYGRVKKLATRGNKDWYIPHYTKTLYGYFSVCIFGRSYPVHRVVAYSFLKPDEARSTVDHINTIRTDNRLCNLRFVTHKENSNNDITKQKYSKAYLDNCEYAGRIVNQYDLFGKYIRSYTIEELNEEIKVKAHRVNIYRACNEKKYQVRKYMWRWDDECPAGKDIEPYEFGSTASPDFIFDTPINQYDKRGKYLKTWSLKELHEHYDSISVEIVRMIIACCKHTKKNKSAVNCQWRYQRDSDCSDIQSLNISKTQHIPHIVEAYKKVGDDLVFIGYYIPDYIMIGERFNCNSRKVNKCIHGELRHAYSNDNPPQIYTFRKKMKSELKGDEIIHAY